MIYTGEITEIYCSDYTAMYLWLDLRHEHVGSITSCVECFIVSPSFKLGLVCQVCFVRRARDVMYITRLHVIHSWLGDTPINKKN